MKRLARIEKQIERQLTGEMGLFYSALKWGIAAGIVVISAFAAFLFGILKIGLFARRNFEKFICVGTAIVFGVQFFLNSGSALGLVPVVGLQFPFLSYGGSSMLSSFFLLAIIGAMKKKF